MRFEYMILYYIAGEDVKNFMNYLLLLRFDSSSSAQNTAITIRDIILQE